MFHILFEIFFPPDTSHHWFSMVFELIAANLFYFELQLQIGDHRSMQLIKIVGNASMAGNDWRR